MTADAVARRARRKIVLDSDMGSDVDDALCLALALAAPEIELLAVTHVAGDTRRRAQISRRLLDLAGRDDVPVYAGRATPLGGGEFPWWGHEGRGILDDVAPPIDAEDAVTALARLCRHHDGVELVAIGPLTNLAAALDADPALARRVARLTVMGGHVRRATYGGRELPPGVDYNLCADPAAALRVLGAGIPTRLVTTDVTVQTWLRQEDVRALEARATPLHATLARLVRLWTPVMHAIFAGMGAATTVDNAAFLHDPLTLAAAYDESFCTFEDLRIEVAVVDGILRTREVAHAGDGASTASRWPVMRCATAVDADRFRAHFLSRVLALRSGPS